MLKAEMVTTHLAIIRQTKLVNPSVESLQAAKEVETALQAVLAGAPDASVVDQPEAALAGVR